MDALKFFPSDIDIHGAGPEILILVRELREKEGKGIPMGCIEGNWCPHKNESSQDMTLIYG